MSLWNSKEKAPGAAEGEEEAFYCLAAGFFSSFPLAAVFIESRCSMIAPGKYHMRTHRESQLQVYGGGSVVCPGSGPQVTALLLPPTPNSRPLSAPPEWTEMFHHPMTSSRRLSWTLRYGFHQLLYNSFIFYTFKKFFRLHDSNNREFAGVFFFFNQKIWSVFVSLPKSWFILLLLFYFIFCQ